MLPYGGLQSGEFSLGRNIRKGMSSGGYLVESSRLKASSHD